MSEIKGSCLRCDYWGVRNQGYLRLEELYLKNAHFSGVRNQGYSVLALSETKGLSSSGTVRKTGYTALVKDTKIHLSTSYGMFCNVVQNKTQYIDFNLNIMVK